MDRVEDERGEESANMEDGIEVGSISEIDEMWKMRWNESKVSSMLLLASVLDHVSHQPFLSPNGNHFWRGDLQKLAFIALLMAPMVPPSSWIPQKEGNIIC